MQFNTNSHRDGDDRAFTPAFPALRLYDPAIRMLTRERTWRSFLLAKLDPKPGELIVDAGCGTGTMLVEIGRRCPEALLIGVDPDARVLALAKRKLEAASVAAELTQGFLAI